MESLWRAILRELQEWAEGVVPLHGLVLVKALWSGRHALDFSEAKVHIPQSVRKSNQPFTLAYVLNSGTGYRDLDTGEWKGSSLKSGDVILAEQFTAFELSLDGRKVNYIPESKIISKVHGLESLETFLEDEIAAKTRELESCVES